MIIGVFLAVIIVFAGIGYLIGRIAKKRKIKIKGAEWYGKVCTGIFDIGIFFLLLFPEMPEQRSNMIVVVMLIAAVLTLLRYIQFHRQLLRA